MAVRMRNQQPRKQWAGTKAFAGFVLMTWLGLRLTEPSVPVREDPLDPAPSVLVSDLRGAPGPSLSDAGSSELSSGVILRSRGEPEPEPEPDLLHSSHLQQCHEALFALGVPAQARHCASESVSERIRDAGMACAATREPEDLGPGSVCESTRVTIQAFLQMLPAYRNPRLIGDSDYPAERFFTGVTEYLQMITPEEQEVLLDAGLAALHQLPETRESLQNAQSWAAYWQDVSPELTGRLVGIEPSFSTKREVSFN